MRKRAGQAFDAVDRTDKFEQEYWYRCICVDRRVSQNAWRWYGYAEKTGWTSKRWLVLYRVSEKWLWITNFQEFLDNRIVKKYPKKEVVRHSMEESAVKKECKSMNDIVSEVRDIIAKDDKWDNEIRDMYTDKGVFTVSLQHDTLPIEEAKEEGQPRYKRLRSVLTRA